MATMSTLSAVVNQIPFNGATIGGKPTPPPAPATSQHQRFYVTPKPVDHGEETPEQEMARLRAENAALKARKSSKLALKVSDKGAVSVYGLGRFPVTLYKEQMKRLMAAKDDIEFFMLENDCNLASKE
jgi:hypothetical protein